MQCRQTHAHLLSHTWVTQSHATQTELWLNASRCCSCITATRRPASKTHVHSAAALLIDEFSKDAIKSPLLPRRVENCHKAAPQKRFSVRGIPVLCHGGRCRTRAPFPTALCARRTPHISLHRNRPGHGSGGRGSGEQQQLGVVEGLHLARAHARTAQPE
jgi:hypothetical protein